MYIVNNVISDKYPLVPYNLIIILLIESETIRTRFLIYNLKIS